MVVQYVIYEIDKPFVEDALSLCNLFFFIEGDVPGLKAEDLEASTATLKSIAETLNYEISKLRERPGEEGMIVEFLLRKKLDVADFMEVR